MLAPHSTQADQTKFLFWLMIGIASGVFVVYIGLLFYAMFRRSTQPSRFERSPASAISFVLIAGALIPLMLLIVVFTYSIRGLAAEQLSSGDPIDIQVVGHQYWWEVKYPGANGFATANEIHIPVGREVVFHVTAADVIHSFWVPQLAGKIDAIPGQDNTLKVKATSAGSYLGHCAEFCGDQHAHMQFLVVAEPDSDYNAWVQGQQAHAATPNSDEALRGQQVFLGSACVYCHAVRGTNASGTLGPDLTHLASRSQLAAGTIPNNIGGLAGWITNPQSIKPGVLMPPTQLSSEDLQSLLAYLMTLK